MDENWSNKVLLVTGGASGIGEACVRRAASAGARVLICDVQGEKGNALADELGAAGHECRFQYMDVTDEAHVAAAIARCMVEFGKIDAAANCAGVTCPPATIERTTLDAWDRVIAINLTGTFLCVKHELAAMKQQGTGTIVNVASGAAVMAAPFMVAYTASKHGILGITKNAVQETLGSGIRINSVLPGTTRTPMLESAMGGDEALEKAILASTPGGRMGTAEEQAAAILWLLSSDSAYVNGDALIVDGGGICR